MSKIKNGGLDQYGAGPSKNSNFEQLALKGLSQLASHKDCKPAISSLCMGSNT